MWRLDSVSGDSASLYEYITARTESGTTTEHLCRSHVEQWPRAHLWESGWKHASPLSEGCVTSGKPHDLFVLFCLSSFLLCHSWVESRWRVTSHWSQETRSQRLNPILRIFSDEAHVQYVSAIFKVDEQMLITLEINSWYFHKLLRYF